MAFKVKKNNYENDNNLNLHYYIGLSFLLMFYGHNNTFDILSSVSILVLFLINIKNDNFILSYFALIFFEPILELPVIGGSLFRVYQFLFIIRILLDLTNNSKFSLNKKNNIFAAVIYLFLSMIYIRGFESVLSSFVNIFILIYITVYPKKNNYESVISKVLAVVGIFATLSGIYGFIYGNSLYFGYSIRFGATIGDPNYSALFYTLGIFSVLGTDSISKNFKKVLFISLIILLGLTVSLSGILGTVLLLMLYVLLKTKSKSLLYLLLMVLSIVVFMNLDFQTGTTLYGIQFRITSIISSTDLSVATSSRSDLFTNYFQRFRTLPTQNQLFGGINIISGSPRNEYIGYYGDVSHNSYIDMIYLIGYIGTLGILVTFIVNILFLFNKYRKTKSSIMLSLMFLKLTLIYYSLSISIFTFRYFYTFFII